MTYTSSSTQSQIKKANKIMGKSWKDSSRSEKWDRKRDKQKSKNFKGDKKKFKFKPERSEFEEQW